MDANTRPANVPTGQTISRSNFQPTGILGANLVSSNTGEVFGILNIPQKTFAVGERALVLADSDTFSTLVEDSVSTAQGNFNAYNFGADKSNMSVSTREVEISRSRDIFAICASSTKSTSIKGSVIGV